MSQPVKLSDELVLDARLTGEVFQRSIAGQVEYWARLGRSFEDLLDGTHVRGLIRTNSARPLSELVGSLETIEGRERLEEYLESTPYPHFEPHAEDASLLIRTTENGEKTVGRFVDRQFVVDEEASKREKLWVTPQDLARNFKTRPKKIRDWLRSQPRFANNNYQRYKFSKKDPILKDAARVFGDGDVSFNLESTERASAR
jgi:hypothetical protein